LTMNHLKNGLKTISTRFFNLDPTQESEMKK